MVISVLFELGERKSLRNIFFLFYMLSALVLCLVHLKNFGGKENQTNPPGSDIILVRKQPSESITNAFDKLCHFLKINSNSKIQKNNLILVLFSIQGSRFFYSSHTHLYRI